MRRDIFVADEETPTGAKARVLKKRRDRRQGAKVHGITPGIKVDLDSHRVGACVKKTAVLHVLKT